MKTKITIPPQPTLTQSQRKVVMTRAHFLAQALSVAVHLFSQLFSIPFFSVINFSHRTAILETLVAILDFAGGAELQAVSE